MPIIRVSDFMPHYTCELIFSIEEFDQTSVDILSDDGKITFRANGSIIAFDGFLKLYREGLDEGQLKAFGEVMDSVFRDLSCRLEYKLRIGGANE